MRNLAIIPARSGSKGLKDKNIKLLAGRPLLAYTVEAAAASGCFEEIMVSTDSEEYAQAARGNGASVPFLRSRETSSDAASSWDVVKEVLRNYREAGKEFDSVALLQPTSPLRDAEDIRDAYGLFEHRAAKGVVAVCEMEHSPLWANVLPEDHCLDGFLNPALLHQGRQKLESYYRINGAIYIVRLAGSAEPDFNLYGKGCYAYLMPRERSVDIDTQLDFRIAEVLLQENLRS